MIYLIDDKRERQQKLKWSAEKLAHFGDVLFPIYSNTQLQAEKHQLFKTGNAVLFHESFFDNPLNKHDVDSVAIGQALAEYSDRKTFPIVRFSGSMGSRRIDNQLATMPFINVYQNLVVFLENYRETGLISLNKLAFGTNDKVEEILQYKSEIYRSLYDKKDDEPFNLNIKINQNLRQLEQLSNSKIMVDGISNGYLKRQLEAI